MLTRATWPGSLQRMVRRMVMASCACVRRIVSATTEGRAHTSGPQASSEQPLRPPVRFFHCGLESWTGITQWPSQDAGGSARRALVTAEAIADWIKMTHRRHRLRAALQMIARQPRLQLCPEGPQCPRAGAPTAHLEVSAEPFGNSCAYASNPPNDPSSATRPTGGAS